MAELVDARALRALVPMGRGGSSPPFGTTECGSVGRARALGARGPRFESGHSDSILFVKKL